MIDVCVIGYVTKDIVRINHHQKVLPGGTAYYTSLALKNLGLNVAVVTKIGEKDLHLIDELKKKNITLFLTTNTSTTVFENTYRKTLDGEKERIQKVKSTASPFLLNNIPEIYPKIFHLGPLVRGDINLFIFKLLAERATICLDVQGFVRKIVNGWVKKEDWKEKEKVLPYVSILKTDEIEAEILTGERDLKKAVKKLSSFGPREVIITSGSNGSLIFVEGEFYPVPAYPPEKFVDPTGCGDTYMAGYIYKKLKNSRVRTDFVEIGKFAAAVSSLKLAKHGPFEGTIKDVEDFLRKQNESSNNCCWKR